jgi:TusE/DsrC/DsvC family sulfur relay protein
MNEIAFGERRIAVDERGYLRDYGDWSEALAEHIAAADGLVLDDARWDIIRLLRGHFEEFRIAPPMRLLVREVGRRFGPDKASSRYLYRLFPDGPAKQACRYAGLPKPVSCL